MLTNTKNTPIDRARPSVPMRVNLPTKELLRLVYERKIRYVMVDGIAHIPEYAVDDYRREAAS